MSLCLSYIHPYIVHIIQLFVILMIVELCGTNQTEWTEWGCWRQMLAAVLNWVGCRWKTSMSSFCRLVCTDLYVKHFTTYQQAHSLCHIKMTTRLSMNMKLRYTDALAIAPKAVGYLTIMNYFPIWNEKYFVSHKIVFTFGQGSLQTPFGNGAFQNRAVHKC